MAHRQTKRVPGLFTGLALVLAVIANQQDWHWVLRACIWICAIAGMVWAGWDKVDQATRDESARGAQPGLYSGSQMTGDAGGGGGGEG